MKMHVGAWFAAGEAIDAVLPFRAGILHRLVRALQPSSVGPYEILDKIGQGAMGEVYLANDPRLHRKVAIKRLADGGASALLEQKRVLQEARAVARLNHPNIAAVYDVIDADGQTHIVMEYVAGKSLAAMVALGPMPPKVVASLGRQLADGLAEAHRAGVVHRDLKPANVMVDAAGNVKILDFGIARRLTSETSPTADEALGTTASAIGDATNPRAGTPAYMAPERFRGEPATVRTDIYSLGVLLYECLTGRRPFAGSLESLRAAVLGSTVPALDVVLPGSPRALNRVVSRALERDPLQRYGDASELSHDLRAASNAMDSAATSGRWARLRVAPWGRRLLPAAALVVAAAAGSFAWRARAPTPAFDARDWVLIADFDNSTGNPVFDVTAREGMETALSQSSYVNVFPRVRAVETLVRMQRAPAATIDPATALEICRREGIAVLLSGSVRSLGERHQLRAQAVEIRTGRLLFATAAEFGAREELFRTVDQLSRQVRQDLGESMPSIERSTEALEKATTSSLRALELYSRGRDAKARGELDIATQLLNEALTADPRFAMAHLLLADLSLYKGDASGELEHSRRAYELRFGATERERLLIEGSHHQTLEDYGSAATSFQALVDLYPDDRDGRYALAHAYSALGKAERAVAAMREVVRIDPRNTDALAYLGLFLLDTGRPDETRATLESADARGLTAPLFGWALGLAALDRRDFAAAARDFDRLAAARPGLAAAQRLKLALHRGQLEAAIAMASEEMRANRYGTLTRTLWPRFRAQARLLSGDRRGARTDALSVLSGDPAGSYAEATWLAGRLLLELGDQRMATQALARLRSKERRAPFDRFCVRNLEGRLALAAGDVARAVQLFRGALDEYPGYQARMDLARALLAVGDPVAAMAQWQEVLGNPTLVLHKGFPTDLAVAQLELARTERRAGRQAAARQSYDALLGSWAEGDPVPLIREARAERAALGTGSSEAAKGVPVDKE